MAVSAFYHALRAAVGLTLLCAAAGCQSAAPRPSPAAAPEPEPPSARPEPPKPAAEKPPAPPVSAEKPQDPQPDARREPQPPIDPQPEPAPEAEVPAPPSPGEEPELPEYITRLERIESARGHRLDAEFRQQGVIVLSTANIRRLRVERSRLPTRVASSIAVRIDGQGIEWSPRHQWIELERSSVGQWQVVARYPDAP